MPLDADLPVNCSRLQSARRPEGIRQTSRRPWRLVWPSPEWMGKSGPTGLHGGPEPPPAIATSLRRPRHFSHFPPAREPLGERVGGPIGPGGLVLPAPAVPAQWSSFLFHFLELFFLLFECRPCAASAHGVSRTSEPRNTMSRSDAGKCFFYFFHLDFLLFFCGAESEKYQKSSDF